jgi:hypothetical protein
MESGKIQILAKAPELDERAMLPVNSVLAHYFLEE